MSPRSRLAAAIVTLHALGSWLLFGCGAKSHDVDARQQQIATGGTRSVADPRGLSAGSGGGTRSPTVGHGGASGAPVVGEGPSAGMSGDGAASLAADGGAAGTSGGAINCGEALDNQPPEDLACTGLYSDLPSKALASGVRIFAPAEQLWSDGADKRRFILLPEGARIDASNGDDWRFPPGTKLFKEFSWKGRRVETRLFWKREDRWLRTAYRWNEEETRADRFEGGDVDVDGDSYHIPSAQECDRCHKGRTDRVLGFEAVLLGLPGAQGITLADLVREGRLEQSPPTSSFAFGEGVSATAAPALLWLHVNCGVSCHNANSAADAYSSRLRLRLSAAQLAGGGGDPPDAITTTVGVAATTPRWSGRLRVVPGSPEQSLLYVLATQRGPADFKDQMPPIASRVVPEHGRQLLERWISSLPSEPGASDADGGAP